LKSDFEGLEGKKLENYFKNVFLDQYKKYSAGVKQALDLASN
jgi:hypothetical protein